MTESPELSGQPRDAFGDPGNETKPLGAGSMLVKIFSEPSAVFRSIKAKSSWALPLILFLLVITVTGIVSYPYQIDMQRQLIERNENMSQEQRDLAFQQMEAAKSNPVWMSFGVGAQVVGAVIFLFIIVGLYMLMGSVILGGSATFGQVFSVAVWSGIPMVVGSIVKAPLILSKQSLDVRTSLALLMPDAPITDTMVAILNSLTDVFTIWAVILTIIGISIVYNFSKGKAAVVVLVPTLIISAIGIGIGSMFGG